MSPFRRFLGLALSLAAALAFLSASSAQPVPLPPPKKDANKSAPPVQDAGQAKPPMKGGKVGKPMGPQGPVVANEVIQEFPSNEVMQTAWKVHWTTQRGPGLIIAGAWYKRTPADALPR